MPDQLDIPMNDHADIAPETAGQRDSYNGRLAIVVAVLSAFMAVSNIKSGDITDAARDDQINVVDTWNQYQAKRMRQFMLQGFIRNAEANRGHMPDANLDAAIAEWSAETERYKQELAEISAKARGYEAEFTESRERSSLFDLSDTFATIALALFAVAALTRIRWLFWFAGLAGLGGIVYGIAGFAGGAWYLPSRLFF
jgi:Domain of unknown function (DUF4337)